MSKEKVIDKIRKCLELANNNPSAEEAATAAAMAQRLMAKHDIGAEEVSTEEETEEIARVVSEPIKACKWKYILASTIAENFRCKLLLMGHERVVFFGKATDAAIAAQVFDSLFKMGHKLGLKARAKHKDLYGTGDGVYNSFVQGFCSGIKEVLDAQCVALAIVIQPEVVEAFEEQTKTTRTRSVSQNSNNFSASAFASGHREGKNAMNGKQANQLEG